MAIAVPTTPVEPAGRRTVRPVDAAGLVLLRHGAQGPEVLLGRRHRRAGFLPDIYVFPGGRVDPRDELPSGFNEDLNPNVVRQLGGAGSRRPDASFPRAALRETFEEAGLLLAAPNEGPAPPPSPEPHWQAYRTHGVRPAFARMDFVCRAITPTYSKRRYNTRFFLADGSCVQGALTGDGELEDLAWRPITALDALHIVDVTQFVLAEALRRWRQRRPVGAETARLFCYRERAARWRIGTTGEWRPAPETPLKSAIYQG
ncbi:MAG: NUDIX hydrolase [Dongiaceae bacterium]